MFGGSCGGILGRTEYHRLTGNSGVEKEHLVSVVNWTKEDKSLGRGKSWAEGRLAVYHYLHTQSALPMAAVGITGSDGTFWLVE